MDFVTLENIVKYASPESLQRFRDASLEFDRLYLWSDFMMREFSALVGWKGERPLSFDGFAGIHLECGADSFVLLDGEEPLGSVVLSGVGGLEKDGIFAGLNEEALRREVSRLFHSDRNVEAAKEFTAGGRMLVNGFVVREEEGKRAVFADCPGVPGFREAFEASAPALFGVGCRLELLPSHEYVGALNAQLAIPDGGRDALVGVSPRPRIPEGVRLGFDGLGFDCFDSMAREEGVLPEFRDYVRRIDALGRFCNEACLALNRAAGVQDEVACRQMYHFSSADYLMSIGATPGIVLTSGFGTSRLVFIEPLFGEDGFRLVDQSCNHLADLPLERLTGVLNARLFSDDNIARARDDFRAAGVALAPDRRETEYMKIEFNRSKAILPLL